MDWLPELVAIRVVERERQCLHGYDSGYAMVPLQIGGGIELHGEVYLRAFGIGIGISVDALLEGCARIRSGCTANFMSN